MTKMEFSDQSGCRMGRAGRKVLGQGANLNITEELLKVKAGSGSEDGTWRASERESLKDGGKTVLPQEVSRGQTSSTCAIFWQQPGVKSFCPLPFYPRSKDTVNEASTTLSLPQGRPSCPENFPTYSISFKQRFLVLVFCLFVCLFSAD